MQLAERSRVGLLEQESGRIFYATAAGTYTVATRFGKSSGTPSLFLPAGQAEPMPGYQYAAEGHQPSHWLLIAADLPFDSQLLQQLLQRNAPTTATPCTLHLAK